jgi:hypothetical protein
MACPYYTVIEALARILFALAARSSGLEADGADEFVEIVGDALVEAVELGPLLRRQIGASSPNCRAPGAIGSFPTGIRSAWSS